MTIDPEDSDALPRKVESATDEGVVREAVVGKIITVDVAELDVTDLDARLRRVSATTSDPYQVC